MNKKILVTVGFLLTFSLLGSYLIWIYNRNYVEVFEIKGELFAIEGKINLGPKKNQLNINKVTSRFEGMTLIQGIKLEVIEKNKIIYQRSFGYINKNEPEETSFCKTFTLEDGLEKIRVDSKDKNNLESDLTRIERENWQERITIKITVQKEDQIIIDEALYFK